MTQNFNTTPLLSVCVLTYNQENYIRQCLESLINQATDFQYEIIVGEDCSLDSTRYIVEEFARRYPDLVYPIYQSQNIGAGTNNFISVHNAARGQFIAHLDGDDYSYPGRLQKQVDVLRSEPDCNIVFHRMRIEIKGKFDLIEGPFFDTPSIHEKKFYRADLLLNNSIGWQSSKMYRACMRSTPPTDFEITDVFTTIEQVGGGYAKFASHEALGVYRLQIGITNNRLRIATALCETYKYFHYKYPQYRDQINTAIFTYFLADLKNRRKTAMLYGKTWLSTWRLMSLFMFIRNYSMTKKLIVKFSSTTFD
ncbi:glycosyltransferase [Undibacterium sp.]|uniref:glycosyltransferase family 2 protein n=1 Tax=Undibacterium sp. TaxID=1914977 RepID=UPI0037519B0E